MNSTKQRWKTLALVAMTSVAACRSTSEPQPTSAGVYVLTSVVVPTGDTIAMPGQLPRVGNNDVWITSGSLTLGADGQFQYLERDSLICVTCTNGGQGFSLYTQSFGGVYLLSDTLLLFSDLRGTLTNGVIRVPGLAYGTYQFDKR